MESVHGWNIVMRVVLLILSSHLIGCAGKEGPVAARKPDVDSPKHTTPKSAFKSFLKAANDRDWVAVFHLMTPQLQSSVIEHFAQDVEVRGAEENAQRITSILRRHGAVLSDSSGEWNANLDEVAEPDQLFSALMQLQAESEPRDAPSSFFQLGDAKLQEVIISGETAKGAVTMDDGLTLSIDFRRIDGGWLVHDEPPPPLGEKPNARPYSRELLSQLQADNRTVLVLVRADWCLTSRANDAVFTESSVSEILSRRKVVLLEADWTERNPEVEQLMQEFGKETVPFYLLFIPGKDKPHLLRGGVTRSQVLQLLQET